MLRFQLLHLEQLHKHYSGTKVFNEDVKWGQTWRTGLREANLNVITFISQKWAQLISVKQCMCQSVWQCNCLFVSINITAFGHSFPVHEEEGEYKPWKKCCDPEDLGSPRENLNVSSQEVLSFGDLMQCHVDRLVLPAHGAWCGNWFLCRITLGFVSPSHPSLFLPLTACALSCCLNIVQPLEGELLSPLLRWLFQVTFNIFFLKP